MQDINSFAIYGVLKLIFCIFYYKCLSTCIIWQGKSYSKGCRFVFFKVFSWSFSQLCFSPRFVLTHCKNKNTAIRKTRPHSEFFWSVFSRILTKYGDLQSTPLYLVRIWENKDQSSPSTDAFDAVPYFWDNSLLIHFCPIFHFYTPSKL